MAISTSSLAFSLFLSSEISSATSFSLLSTLFFGSAATSSFLSIDEKFFMVGC
jgi:hypothetical protein